MEAYHDLCKPVEETLCIRIKGANIRGPQFTWDQAENETSDTILVEDASQKADQQVKKKAVANAPLTTSTPARNREEEDTFKEKLGEQKEKYTKKQKLRMKTP